MLANYTGSGCCGEPGTRQQISLLQTDPKEDWRLNTAVEVEQVTKVYPDGTVANDEVSFIVHRGTIAAILGPNGAGKTTLIRQLSTALQPTSGRIRILGLDLESNLQAIKQAISVVPQEIAPPPYITPPELLYAMGRLKGLTAREARTQTDELIEEFELTKLSRKLNSRLSGGNRRRLVVASCLTGNPSLLLLDEPTTGLDPEARHRVWQALRDRQRRGLTVLLTTHYLDEADNLASQVVVILDGRVAADCPPTELKQVVRQFKTVSISCRGMMSADNVVAELTGLGHHAVEASPGIVSVAGAASSQDMLDVIRYALERDLPVSIADPGLEEAYLALVRKGVSA